MCSPIRGLSGDGIFAGIARAVARALEPRIVSPPLKNRSVRRTSWPPHPVDGAALRAPDQGDLVGDRIITTGVDNGPDVVHVAAKAGQVLRERRENTTGRRVRYVSRVVSNGVTDAGDVGDTGGLLHGKRGIVGHVIDLLALESIAQTHLRVFVEREAESEIAAGVALIERGDTLKIDLFVEYVKTRGEIAIEEIRLGEAEIDLGAVKASRETEPDILAFAHQVALGDADIADDAFARGVTGTEGQFAGRLLLDLHHDDRPGRAHCRAAARPPRS